jgi:hypothetical protein
MLYDFGGLGCVGLDVEGNGFVGIIPGNPSNPDMGCLNGISIFGADSDGTSHASETIVPLPDGLLLCPVYYTVGNTGSMQSVPNESQSYRIKIVFRREDSDSCPDDPRIPNGIKLQLQPANILPVEDLAPSSSLGLGEPQTQKRKTTSPVSTQSKRPKPSLTTASKESEMTQYCAQFPPVTISSGAHPIMESQGNLLDPGVREGHASLPYPCWSRMLDLNQDIEMPIVRNIVGQTNSNRQTIEQSPQTAYESLIEQLCTRSNPTTDKNPGNCFIGGRSDRSNTPASTGRSAFQLYSQCQTAHESLIEQLCTPSNPTTDSNPGNVFIGGRSDRSNTPASTGRSAFQLYSQCQTAHESLIAQLCTRSNPTTDKNPGNFFIGGRSDRSNTPASTGRSAFQPYSECRNRILNRMGYNQTPSLPDTVQPTTNNPYSVGHILDPRLDMNIAGTSPSHGQYPLDQEAGNSDSRINNWGMGNAQFNRIVEPTSGSGLSNSNNAQPNTELSLERFPFDLNEAPPSA